LNNLLVIEEYGSYSNHFVAELRAFGADLFQFVKALGHKWKSGVTGGILAVVLSLTGIFGRLPKHVIAAALIGYVIIAAFYAWREQYHAAARLDTPLQKREKLDSLVNEGEHLQNLFKKGKNCEARAARWEKAVLSFVGQIVGQNFTLDEYDRFKLRMRSMGVEKVLSIPGATKDQRREALLQGIGEQLYRLRELRDMIN
jgi:hypothetical protein